MGKGAGSEPQPLRFRPTPRTARASVAEGLYRRTAGSDPSPTFRAVRQQVGETPTLAGLALRNAVGAIGQRPRVSAHKTAKGGERLTRGRDFFKSHLGSTGMPLRCSAAAPRQSYSEIAPLAVPKVSDIRA